MIGIFYGLYFAFTAEKSGFSGYLDIPSLVLLGILPPSIMLLSHKLSDFGTGIKLLFAAIFNNHLRKQSQIINALTKCQAVVRSEGVGALVNERKTLPYDLLKDGVSLIINNFTIEEIKHNLTAKIAARQSHMNLAQNLFENMAKVSPGVGMIGTLMGLIGMMSNLSDPATIGSGMALALITTLYGLLLGTILYAPFGEKIAIESEKSQELDLMVMEGVLALKGKKSSVHLKNIMATYGKSSKTPPKKVADSKSA
jgi:chemotaxis protein MotA